MFQNKLYYMMNKPGGCITARSDASHRTVMEYFPEELAGELFPVGRLDKDTQGLLFLPMMGASTSVLCILSTMHRRDITCLLQAA